MQKTITTNQKVTTNELKDDLTKLTLTALQDVKAPKTGFEYALIYENRTASKINYLSATTFNGSYVNIFLTKHKQLKVKASTDPVSEPISLTLGYKRFDQLVAWLKELSKTPNPKITSINY